MSQRDDARKVNAHLTRRALARQAGVFAGAAFLPGSVVAALAATPRQVEGPFYPVDDQPEKDLDLTRLEGHAAPATGEVILVRGRVLDTSGKPLQGAIVDVWQANHYGRYSHPEDRNSAPLDPNFQGWAILETSGDGRYGFRTVKPGAYYQGRAGESPQRPRHIHFKVSVPDGSTLVTQMYFDGDPLIEQDDVIARVPEERRHLLIAKSTVDEASGVPLYRFDVVLSA